VERLVTGLIIGGAIGSIVGRKLIEEDEEDGLDEANESEDDEA
jgi:Na+/glutamate symporter